MKTLLIGDIDFQRSIEADLAALRPEGALTLETIAIDERATFPVDEIRDKGRRAGRIGWWWNASRSDHYFAQLDAHPDLEAMLGDPEKGFRLFCTESHHRTQELTQLRGRFPRISVPHMRSLDERNAGMEWLPYGCPIGIEEAEHLMRQPYRPEIDIVYPFNLYYLGDRVQRLSAAIERIRCRGDTFRCGTYTSMTPMGYAYEKNYFNVIAAGRVVLNFSIHNDLNQRFFEAGLVGATTLSDKLPDHDALAFDGSNAFFFERDLSNFEDALSEALAHAPTYAPRRHVRNHHLRIHRVAEFLSRLTGIAVGVEAAAPGPDEMSTEGRVEYLVQEGDIEYGDIDIETCALQCCLYNRIEDCIDHEAAYTHLRNIAQRAGPSFCFDEVVTDAVFLATAPISTAEVVRITSANQVDALRDLTRENQQRHKDAAELAAEVRRQAVECTDLSAFRQRIRRFLLS